MPDHPGVEDVIAVYGRDPAGWTTWIPTTLMECHRCSALVMNQPLAMENHERWHARIDGGDHDA
jgi:hypothetical protein